MDRPYRTRTQLIQGSPGPPGIQFSGSALVNALFGATCNALPNQAVKVDTTSATGVSDAVVNLPAPNALGGGAAFDGCFVMIVDFWGSAGVSAITVNATGDTVGNTLVPAGTEVMIAWPSGNAAAVPQSSITLNIQGEAQFLWYSADLGLWVPASLNVSSSGGGGGGTTYTPLTGPTSVTAVHNTIYVCEVTSGNIAIILPALSQGQFVGVIAAAGGTNGAAYATASITITADAPQILALPPPNNVGVAPVASYIIGGASATSGNGALDAGTSLNWVNGGIGHVLSIQ